MKGAYQMKPIRCLIVDDEDLIIQRLQLFFEGLSNTGSPFELVGKAYSGDEGLEEAARLQPDLVITDIIMPGMDGITMIEQMKTAMPHTDFIILSAYSDFHYAKRAIQVDVSDYIVKVPLNEDELLQAMNKAALHLREARQKEEQLRKLDMSILNNRYRVFKQFFQELLQGEIKTEQADGVMSSYDMRLLQDSYCCIVMEMDHYTTFINQYPISDQSILKYGILNVVEETLRDFGSSFACDIDRHRFIGFLSWPYMHSMQESELKYWQVGQTLVANVQTYLKQSISVGMSLPATGWREIPAAYAKALAACESHYYTGAEAVITPFQPAASGTGDARRVRSRLQDICQMLQRELEDAEEIKSALQSLRSLAEGERLPKTVMTGLLKEFMIAARSRLAMWKQDMEEAGDEGLDYMTLAEQIEFLTAQLADHVVSRDVPSRSDIAKAVDYIERNLTERLSLQVIAKQANLAPAYFSSLFKKEMKESLVDYINRKKIERAAELLQVSSYSNQELCDIVGIMNEAYFCTLFKQKTGSTPRQYCKTVQQSAGPR
ncbi:response regulator [Paenibacillaceae bacterium]|nr:response regulator [Paenibacillaceae bacterium]